MEFALDCFTNEPVAAESRQARLVKCICPGCYEEVILAGGSGTYQRAHFRHFAHLGPETCEYRAFPGYEPQLLNPSKWFHRPKVLELFFDISCDSWELKLLVPRYNGDFQFSLGSCSLGGFTYYSNEIPSGGRTFPVFPQSEPYEVDICAREGLLRKAVMQGLGPISVFNIGGARGRRQPENHPLKWGQIVAVLTQQVIYEGAIPDKLYIKWLKPKNDWHACLIGLPIAPDARVADWADKVLGKRIGAASEYVLSLLGPVGVRRADDGTWLVTQQEVTLAVESNDKARISTSVTFTREGENHGKQRWVSFSNGLAVFPVTLPAGCSRICVGDSSLQVEVIERFVDIPAPRVSLIFDVDGQLHRVPIYCNKLHGHLEQVRVGRVRLCDCSIPSACVLNATFMHAGRSERATLIGTEASLNSSISVKFASDLEGWIKGGLGTLVVDANGFGSFVFPAPECRDNGRARSYGTIDHRRLWLNAAKKWGRSSGNRLLVHERALERSKI